MVAIAISVAAARSRDGYTADSTIGSTDSEHKELLKEKAILSKLNMEDFTKPSENILSQPNEKDIIELNKMYFFKSSESLFEIYNNRHSDEYRQEAIETVRRILARRLEDFLKKKNEDQL